jgi:hypothetical protein
MFLQHDDATPHTSVATSVAIESIRFEVVPHLPDSLDLAPSDFVVCSSQDTSQRNSFTCGEKMVSRTA